MADADVLQLVPSTHSAPVQYNIDTISPNDCDEKAPMTSQMTVEASALPTTLQVLHLSFASCELLQIVFCLSPS